MLKKINKKLLFIILASVFAGIVITVVSNQIVSATTQTSFCLKCHDAPEFVDKRNVTPHAQIDCLSCHGEGFVQDKINGVGHVIKTVSGRYDPNNYLDIKAEVADEKCLSCHNINNISRSETVLTMHNIFIENQFTCTECHDAEFMHGRLGDYSDN